MLGACNGNGDDENEYNGSLDAAAGVVEVGDTVFVEYTGRLSDGEVFDSSVDRGIPLDFVAGAGMMIEGFDAAVLGMALGEEKTVEIPADQAYGSQGVPDQMGGYIIPPDADLTFDIKVVDIIKPSAETESE